MNVIFTRIALEELSFSGGNGYLPRELIDKTYVRVADGLNNNSSLQLKNENIKVSIISEIIKHPSTKIINTEDGSECPIEFALSKTPNFEGIRIYSNELLQRHVLDLNIYSNISEVEGRLAVYMAIAGKGHNGCWQYEISKMLNMDPKMVFQHLKSLYKYDVIVRFSLPIPVNHKKKLFASDDSNQISSGHVSAIIWLTRFFDFNHIPPDLSQLIWCQHIQPLSAEIVRILEHKAPGKIAWEKDIRTLCTGFLVLHGENSADHLICSQRTANKVFNRIRDTLLTKNVMRVFAWNHSTKSYCPCLCLKNAFSKTNIEVLKDQLTIKSEVEVPTINELSISPEKIRNIDSLVSFGDFEKFSNEGVFIDTSIEENNNYFNEKNIFELTEIDQVLWLIRTSGKVGMVSLEIVKLIGINIKRLGKLLADLCKIGIIYKVPQRYNRTFMYRYYYYLNKTGIVENQTGSDNISDQIDSLNDETSVISQIFYEAFPNGNNDLSNFTEQFVRRLALAKKWIEGYGILTIPEFAKLFSDAENTPKGPDRKTIRRILSKLKEIDNTIKETFISSDKHTNNSKSGDITVFFSSKKFEEDEARNLKVIQLKSKRSTSTKHAIEKRKRELSHVAAIADSSIAITPKLNNYSTDNLKEKNIDMHEPKLIFSENGNTTVVVDTNFTVASLNIEIDDEFKSRNYLNSSKVSEISNLNIPGTFPTLNSPERFDPSKRINLGFSSLYKGSIKLSSNVKEIGFMAFNQKILAHYGFVFPLMIRLKILHLHVISIFNDTDNNILSTRDILEEMTIDVFLRVIGLGYRSSFIEDYLMFGSCDSFMFNSNTRLKELPENIHETLTKIRTKRNNSDNKVIDNTQSFLDSRTRKATHILFKMLNLLVKLNLLSHENTENNCNSIINKEPSKCSVINTISISNFKWRVNISVKIPLIANSSLFSNDELIRYINHEERIFDLKKENEVENYWTSLYNESIETQKFLIGSSFKEYSLLLPEIILKRHWKINTLLSLDKRNYLENYARKLVFRKNQCNENDNAPIVLSLASPEIKQISTELSITPLTALRYLLRVVDSISIDERNLLNDKVNSRKVIFHPIRDPRYQCHICYALYSTHPAIISHYKVIHEISTINSSMYTIKKSESLNSKNRNLNLNSSLKTQIIYDNYIPASLMHLIEDTNREYDDFIEKNVRINLLVAFLRLKKEDISLFYFMLFISQKIYSKCYNPNTNKTSNLKTIFSLCNDKQNEENNLYTPQFSRIKSLITKDIGKSDEILTSSIKFLFSCLRTIYPLNSKLVETLKLKESQRICWSISLESNSFSNRWKKFLISQSGTDVDLANSLIDEPNTNLYIGDSTVFEIKDFLEQKKIGHEIDNFLKINKIRSVLLTRMYMVNIDELVDGMDLSLVESYIEYCVKKDILKPFNKQNEFKMNDANSPKKYTFSKNMLINCFGKTVIWREIYDICLADLEILYSNSKKISVGSKINGIYVLNHLNNFLDQKCIFDIEWSDEGFYEKVTNKTNEDLLRLLNEMTEHGLGSDDVDIFEEFSFDIHSQDRECLNFIEDDQPIIEKNKLSKMDDMNIRSETQEYLVEEKVIPEISRIIANYSCCHNDLSEVFNISITQKIPFIGVVDSDPIEINKIPCIFSIRGILRNYSEVEIANLKRNKTYDPIIQIIRKIFSVLKSDLEIKETLLTVISLIVINMRNRLFLSIGEIEYLFLSIDEKSIKTLNFVIYEVEDPGVVIYKVNVPLTYHIMFFLEFIRICTRVPIGSEWLYTLYSPERDFSNTIQPDIKSDLCKCSDGLKIPINIPTRIWLLWSSDSLEQIFSKEEIIFIYYIINNSVNKSEKLKKKELYFDLNEEGRRPYNSLISTDGNINRSICSILMYHICYCINKHPITDISEFTSKFLIFDPCEIKLIIESMLGEKCLYTKNTDIIFSKPISSVFRIFEY